MNPITIIGASLVGLAGFMLGGAYGTTREVKKTFSSNGVNEVGDIHAYIELMRARAIKKYMSEGAKTQQANSN